MNLDLAREIYYRQLDGRFKQDNRMGTQVGLLTLIGGVLAFLVRHLWPLKSSLGSVGLGLSVAAAAFHLLAVFYVVRATIGYTYERLPSPETLREYFSALETYHQENPSSVGSAQKCFDEFLIRKMCSAASQNEINNLTRSAHFYRSNQMLMIAVALGVMAGIVLALCHVK